MGKIKGVLIVLFGPSRIGKTSTITRVAQKLGMDQPYGEDFSAVCPHSLFDFKIGMASMGDPGSSQKESITGLIKDGCRIIVCASRTRGDTVGDLNDLSKKYGYAIIWGTPFYEIVDCINPSVMHEANADAVLSLIEKIALVL